MSHFHITTSALIAVVALTTPARCADPLPFNELLQGLKDPDRMKQEAAATAILAHHKDKALEAFPAVMECLGHELNRFPANEIGRACLLSQELPKLASAAGQDRIKLAFEATKHKDPFVRTGALCLLYRATEGKDAKVDLKELLVVIQTAVKDGNQLVQAQAVQGLRAFADADPKLTVQAVDLLNNVLLSPGSAPMKNVLHSPAFEAAAGLVVYKAKGRSALKGLVACAGSKEDNLAISESCRALGLLARADKTVAAEVVDALMPLVSDATRKSQHRASAVEGIGLTGQAGKKAVPQLIKILEDADSTDALRGVSYQAIEQIGPYAVEAVPLLIKRLASVDSRAEQTSILRSIQGIGPSASEAIKPLEQWIGTVQDRRLKAQADATLMAIK